MTEKRLTKKDKFAMLMEIAEVKENEMLMDFIEHEIELLSRERKTAEGERKPTKNQIANMVLSEKIYGIIAASDEPMTVTEILKSDEELSELSNQKIASVVNRLLVKTERVVKSTDKNRTTFAVKE